jgi:GNAT superfamily N-acetyltransferase
VTVEVRPVSSKREREAFIKLPWRLYAGESNWVAPLLFERRQFLDPRKNPFFQHAQVQLFLAWRDGRVVGRISAHVDENLNAFQDNRWGLFGFFECEDDPEAARALIDAADVWLRARGRDRMVGPMSFTTNDECGLLIEGHERTPIILSDWHHPYYQRLLEDAVGLDKAMDLLMWDLQVENRHLVHEGIWKVADEVETKHGIVCRNFSKKDLGAEVERFLEVYNSAWERNWGFVPLSDDEVRHYAKTLKPVLDENWAMIAERKDTGEVVGAALTLPDYNQVLHKLNGRLLPTGWLTALRARKKIDRVRVFALGVKPEYQHTGVAARFYQMHFDAAERTPQTGGEMGWILETNKSMNRAMEGMGGKVVRKFRLYERTL